MTAATDTSITPTNAIRSAIRALQRERIERVRNPSQSIPQVEEAEIVAQIEAEIAALEQAIKQLQQFETLRGILKSVVE